MRPRVLPPAQAMTVPGLCVQLAAELRGAALWECSTGLGSCMAYPCVWGCPCVALSPLPSLPQQGHRVGAKQKKAFGIGLGRSREWAQILPGSLTPFLGVPVASAAACKAPATVLGAVPAVTQLSSACRLGIPEQRCSAALQKETARTCWNIKNGFI